MTDHPRIRITDRQAAGWGAFSAARRGCTCDPDIVIRRDGPSIVHVQVQHDDWCPVHPDNRGGDR